MPGQKRTRPRSVGQQQRPDRTNALLALNAPHPGCCKPYPHARFVDQRMVELYAHHHGPQCKGFMEPMDIERWNADVDAAARGRAGGDER